MELVHCTVEGVDVIKLSGRFDSYQVPTMNAWLDSHPSRQRVVINLAEVGFIDTSGLSTLVKGLQRCHGKFYLCNLQQAVQIILELTCLDKAFTIYDDEQSAINALTA